MPPPPAPKSALDAFPPAPSSIPEGDFAAGPDRAPAATKENEALPAGQASEDVPVLPLSDAVARIPPSLAAVFRDRLRGEFREVRAYRPKSTIASTISSKPDFDLEDIPLEDGEGSED